MDLTPLGTIDRYPTRTVVRHGICQTQTFGTPGQSEGFLSFLSPGIYSPGELEVVRYYHYHMPDRPKGTTVVRADLVNIGIGVDAADFSIDKPGTPLGNAQLWDHTELQLGQEHEILHISIPSEFTVPDVGYAVRLRLITTDLRSSTYYKLATQGATLTSTISPLTPQVPPEAVDVINLLAMILGVDPATLEAVIATLPKS